MFVSCSSYEKMPSRKYLHSFQVVSQDPRIFLSHFGGLFAHNKMLSNFKVRLSCWIHPPYLSSLLLPPRPLHPPLPRRRHRRPLDRLDLQEVPLLLQPLKLIKIS